MRLYIVGQLRQGAQWEFQGVFDTSEAAVAACTSERHFVGPVELNESIPDEPAPEWPGAWFPVPAKAPQ